MPPAGPVLRSFSRTSTYAAAVTTEMRRFLTARFFTMLGWVVLLGAGFALFMAVTSHVDNDFVGWAANLATLGASIKLGLLLQDRVLARVDPDGRLRVQVASLGANAEDESGGTPALRRARVGMKQATRPAEPAGDGPLALIRQG